MKPKEFVRATFCTLVVAMLFTFSLPAVSEEEKTQPPQIEQLDEERFRIGTIVVEPLPFAVQSFRGGPVPTLQVNNTSFGGSPQVKKSAS